MRNPAPALVHTLPPAARSASRAPLSFALADFVESRSLRCVGLGLFYAWAWVLCQSPLLYHGTSPLAMGRAFWITSLAVAQVVWIPLLLNKVPGLSLITRKPFLYGVPIAMSVGTIVIATTRGGTMASWIQVCLGAALAGLGIGAMPVMWGEIYGALRTKRASVGVSLSAMTAMGVYFAILNIPSPVLQVVVVAALPIACAALLQSSARITPRAEPRAEVRMRARKSSLRLVVIPAGYGLVYGVVVGMTNLLSTAHFASSGAATVIGSAVGAALLLAAAIMFWRKLDIVGFTYQMIVPILGVGLALLPFTGNPLFASGLVLSGFLIFDFIMYAIFADISYRLGYPPVRVFALGRSVSHAGVLIGVVGGQLLSANMTLSQGQLVTVSLVLLYVLIFALAFALNAPGVTSSLSLVPRHAEAAPTAPIPAAQPNIPPDCHALAVSCGLTRREEEVLALLAEGRTLPHIEKALYISEGTTKYHVHNIYGKLDVHNRQALFDRLEVCRKGPADDALPDLPARASLDLVQQRLP